MYFALQTCPYNGLFIEEEITVARREGFGSFVINFSGFNPWNLDEKSLERIALLTEEANLDLLLRFPADEHPEVLWSAVIDVAKRLKPSLILLDYHPDLTKEILKSDCDYCIALVNTIDANLLSLNLTNAINTLSKHCSTGLAYHPRIEAMISGENEIIEILKITQDRGIPLKAVFCHDWHPLDNDKRSLPFGDGILPNSELILYLRKTSFDGSLIFDHWEGRGRCMSRIRELLAVPINILELVTSVASIKTFFPANIDRSRIFIDQIKVNYIGNELKDKITLRSALNYAPSLEWECMQDDYQTWKNENLQLTETEYSKNMMYAFYDDLGNWDNNKGKDYFVSLETLKVPYIIDIHCHADTGDEVSLLQDLIVKNGVDLAFVSTPNPYIVKGFKGLKAIWQIRSPEEYSFEVLIDYLKKEVVIGVSINPFQIGIPLIAEFWYPLWNYLQNIQLPIQIPLFGSDYSFIEAISLISERFPQLKMILTHFGKTEHIPGLNTKILESIEQNKNLSVDTSESDAQWLRLLLNSLGERRILFGTHTPYVSPEDGDMGYRNSILNLERLNLSIQKLNAITSENAINLYKLSL